MFKLQSYERNVVVTRDSSDGRMGALLILGIELYGNNKSYMLYLYPSDKFEVVVDGVDELL